MRTPACHITIGDLSFDFMHDIEIESGWNMLTDIASIKQPSKLKLDKDNLKDVVKKGDAVQIDLGYDDKLSTIYKGFITDIMPSTPIEFGCEDDMWLLKQLNINTSFDGGDLGDFLGSIFPGVEIDAFDISAAPIYFADVNGAKVLDQIKTDYRLYSFFRDGRLVVGKQYDPDRASRHTFELDYDTPEDNLVFKSKEDVKVAVKAISNFPDGTKKTVELGEKGGDTTTLNFFNLEESELKKAAEKEIERLKYDGWRGSFTAFGDPIVNHGDIVHLIHEDESDKTGDYWVDKVITNFGMSGFRQEITLGAVT